MSMKSIADSAAAHGPSELERVGYLDGWRGLAIALVLQHHFFGADWANTGRLGVDIFFCLSGLLMGRILFVRRVGLGEFYKRRISRIVPSFLLYVLAVYGFAWATGDAPGWVEFCATLAFLRAYVPAQPHMFANGYPIGHLWSLNVEEHCYVLLSALTLLAFLKGREGLALIAAGTLAIAIHLAYAALPEWAPPSGFWIRTEVAASNLLLSAGYCLLSAKAARFVKPWMPISAFCLGAALYLNGWFGWTAAMAVSPFLLAFSINHLAQAPLAVRAALAAAPLRLLGICSYSIYLWQQPFYRYLKGHAAADGEALLLLSAALAVGAAMFYVFENPIRRYLNKAW